MQNFSVLMSLYYKEKPEYARACFESLLAQTVQADEWVIVEDGPLTGELYALLDEYEAKCPGLIHRVPLKENVGLGKALREGVTHCQNELIARMDTPGHRSRRHSWENRSRDSSRSHYSRVP